MKTQATNEVNETINHLYKQLPTTYFKGVLYPAIDKDGNQWKIRRTSKSNTVYFHMVRGDWHYVVNMVTKVVEIR
jgi:hypothetical protein